MSEEESEEQDESKIGKVLKTKTATFFAFGMALLAIAGPFFALRSQVKLLQQKVESYNTISSNHLSEIEADIDRLENNSKSNEKRLEQISTDIAEIKALIEDTH